MESVSFFGWGRRLALLCSCVQKEVGVLDGRGVGALASSVECFQSVLRFSIKFKRINYTLDYIV